MVRRSHSQRARTRLHELQRIDLARDVFAWAYDRSCLRYTVVRQVEPARHTIALMFRHVPSIMHAHVQAAPAISRA